MFCDKSSTLSDEVRNCTQKQRGEVAWETISVNSCGDACPELPALTVEKIFISYIHVKSTLYCTELSNLIGRFSRSFFFSEESNCSSFRPSGILLIHSTSDVFIQNKTQFLCQ